MNNFSQRDKRLEKRVRLLRQKRYGVMIGIIGTVILFVLAFTIGTLDNGFPKTLSVVLTSIPLEVVIGAAASVPLGFDPVVGALVAAISHLALAPIIITGFNTLVRKWHWLRNKLRKAESISKKYGKFGVWVLTPLAPFIGVFICVAVGILLRFRPVLIMTSVSLGTLIAAFAATMGGAGIKSLFQL
ncbi:MAG: hypothetical protein ACO1OC_10355 [Tuberibacillus sp.]